MTTGESVKFDWMIRTLDPRVEKDKRSIAHANAGIGYHVLATPKPGANYYVVAFKYFSGPIPAGYDRATTSQAHSLDKLDARRYSLNR